MADTFVIWVADQNDTLVLLKSMRCVSVLLGRCLRSHHLQGWRSPACLNDTIFRE